MTSPSDKTPATEALLLQGLEACFATAQGNVQTPRSILEFLRIAYLPAIEAEAHREAAERVRTLFDEASPLSAYLRADVLAILTETER